MIVALLTAPTAVMRDGASHQRALRGAARLRRLGELHQLASARTAAEQRELDGLLSRGETYDADGHSADHRAFKDAHNRIFASLAAFAAAASTDDASCFFLDGPDGATTAALRKAGFGTDQLHTVNLFESTCAALRRPPHALVHVHPGCAELELARPPLSSTPFAAFYLDGCSGSAAPLVAAVDAIFDERRRDLHPARVAIGFTLTRAEPSGRSLGDRELDVLRALAAGCRAHGFAPPVHVADEPALWGLEAVGKEEGGTLTTWVLCVKARAEVRLLTGTAS
eukprot:7378809-Prymnesium_polylepis.1